MADYWDKYWQSRTSRRRFIGAASAAGVGAAGLAMSAAAMTTARRAA